MKKYSIEDLLCAHGNFATTGYVVCYVQGSHRLERYLNLEGLLEFMSLKIKSALKSTAKSLKGLEKSLNSAILCRTQNCS